MTGSKKVTAAAVGLVRRHVPGVVNTCKAGLRIPTPRRRQNWSRDEWCCFPERAARLLA